MTSYQPNKTKIKVGLYFFSNFIEKYVTNPISDSFDFFKTFLSVVDRAKRITFKNQLHVQKKIIKKG